MGVNSPFSTVKGSDSSLITLAWEGGREGRGGWGWVGGCVGGGAGEGVYTCSNDFSSDSFEYLQMSS